MSYENLIKDIINKDHVNKLYNENDLPNIINGIKVLIVNEYDVDDYDLTINYWNCIQKGTTDFIKFALIVILFIEERMNRILNGKNRNCGLSGETEGK